MNINLAKCLEKIGVQTSFTHSGLITDEASFNNVEWLASVTNEVGEYSVDARPAEVTWAAVQAAQIEIDSEYAAQQYARDRAAAYPSLADQLDMLYHDAVDGTTIWQEAVAAVKAAHPKPEA